MTSLFAVASNQPCSAEIVHSRCADRHRGRGLPLRELLPDVGKVVEGRANLPPHVIELLSLRMRGLVLADRAHVVPVSIR
jgi:hypothetical protein